jgi:hypothetical protein
MGKRRGDKWPSGWKLFVSTYHVLLLLAVGSFAGGVAADDRLELQRGSVRRAMTRAASYFFSEVSVHGGYVYHYSPDLKTRWGEGLAGPEQIWVQPPATPTVGMAYLTAFHATQDPLFLQAAEAAGQALLYVNYARGVGETWSISNPELDNLLTIATDRETPGDPTPPRWMMVKRKPPCVS